MREIYGFTNYFIIKVKLKGKCSALMDVYSFMLHINEEAVIHTHDV